jgi:Protein of unknown function (DUF2378)
MEPNQTRLIRSIDQLSHDPDVEAHLAGIPAHAKVKSSAGNKFEDLLSQHHPRALPVFRELHPKRFSTFQDVTTRQAIVRMVDMARLLEPSLPLAEALRRVGRLIYSDLLASAWGKIVFGLLGRDIESILRLGPRGYEFMEGSRVTYTKLGEGHFRYDFDPCYLWIDSFQVGVIEGAASFVHKKTEINVSLKSRYTGSLECRLL